MSKNIFFIIGFLFWCGCFSLLQSKEYSAEKELKDKKNLNVVSLTTTELEKFLKDLEKVLNPQFEKKQSFGKNPFLPGIKTEDKKKRKEKNTKKEKTLELKGIVIHKNQRYIIVGEEILGVGDLVLGKTILKIEMGKVVLLSGGKFETIILE